MADEKQTNTPQTEGAEQAAELNTAQLPKAEKADEENGAASKKLKARQKRKANTDTEQKRFKKEEQVRNQRRRSRQLIGLVLSVLIVVGAISIVTGGYELVQSLSDSDEDRQQYQDLYEPLVWFDILPFESVSQVDENSIKQAVIWGVLNERGAELERTENGEALVPASDVDQYAVRIFGPDFRFSGHETFTDPIQGLVYPFNAETQMYTAPVTSLQPEFYASAVEIVNEAGGVRRLVMGYISTRTSDDQLIADLDYNSPARYMDFMLRRDGGEYYLYAIQRNTTHEVPVDSTAEPDEPQPEDSSSEQQAIAPPTSSVAAESSSADTTAAETEADAGADTADEGAAAEDEAA